MRIMGLTGTIGSGKSTVTALLRSQRIPVHDADATVHALLETPEIRAALRERLPELILEPRVDRRQLATLAFGDPEILRWLEGLLHPLVGQAQAAFLKHQARLRRPWVVLDVPLLFETQQHQACDWVCVMKASAPLQAMRVLRRKGVTQDVMEKIQGAQGSVAEKVKKADTVLMSGLHKGHLFRKLKGMFQQARLASDTPPRWRPGWKQNQGRHEER